MIPIRFIKGVPIPLALIALLLFLSLFSSCDQSNSGLGRPTLAICQGQVDSDQDGVCDILENQIGTNPNNPNTDSPIDPFDDGVDFNPTNDGRAFTNSGGQTGWLPLGILSSVGLILWAKDKYIRGKESSDPDPNDGDDGTDTSHPKSDAELVDKLNKNTAAGVIDFPKSYIRFMQRSSAPNSQGILITYIDATIEGIHFVALAIERQDTNYPVNLCYKCAVEPSTYPTVDYNLNPAIYREFVKDDSLAESAFRAAESNDVASIWKFNGYYIRRADENRYRSIDPEGLHNFIISDDWLSTMDSQYGRMQFYAPPIGVPLPNAGGVNQTHLCSLPYGDGMHQIGRCLMFTYIFNPDPTSPRTASTWVRKELSYLPPAATPNVLPWEGKWMRVPQ